MPLLREKWRIRALQVLSGDTMAQKSQIVAELKNALRASGHTYADVAKTLDLSVASVKRLFSTEDLSLHRVDQICDLIGLDLRDILDRALDRPAVLLVACENVAQIRLFDLTFFGQHRNQFLRGSW